ncbi:MAG: ABC transporter permease subunit [Thermoplasmata archaeon]|nr:ABC transporter permease subunit [Thermoplasmata archaeon]
MRVGSTLATLPLLGFLFAFAAVPVGVLLASALLAPGGAGAAWRLLNDPLTRQAIANSLLQGSASAVAALSLGYPTGVFLGRWNFPGRRLALALLPVPFLLPSLVMILAISELLGTGGLLLDSFPLLGGLAHGLAGVLLLNLLFNAPIVALLTATAVQATPVEQEEAAAGLGASPFRVYRDVWGPASFAAAGAGALLTFLYSAFGFAAPLILCGPRCYTVEDRVFVLVQFLAEPGPAALLAFWGLLLLLPLLLGYVLLLRRASRRSVRRTRFPRPVRRASWPVLPLALATAVLLGSELLVLGAVLWEAVGVPSALAHASALLGPAATQRVGASTATALLNSLVFAGLAAGVVVCLAVSAGVALRGSRRAAVVIDGLLFLPLLISPVLLAFSLANFWRPALGGANSVWLLIVLSQATAALPLAVPPLLRSLAQLRRGASEAAATLGASPIAAFLDTELPQSARALGSCALLATAIGLGEFTATYFLFLPRFTTLPVELYLLEGARQGALVPVAGAVLLLLSLLLFLGVELGGRRLAA